MSSQETAQPGHSPAHTPAFKETSEAVFIFDFLLLYNFFLNEGVPLDASSAGTHSARALPLPSKTITELSPACAWS